MTLSSEEQRILDAIDQTRTTRGKSTFQNARSPGPWIVEQSEHTRRGGPSRIAAQVRRNRHEFRHLLCIVISQNAPPWRRKALATYESPKGLQTILTYDKDVYKELWYKTATRGHKAKIFVR